LSHYVPELLDWRNPYFSSAPRGERIRQLYEGSSECYPSTSEADMALLGYLTFYTQDAEQLARLFKDSSRYQPNKRWGGERYIALSLAEEYKTDGVLWGVVMRLGMAMMGNERATDVSPPPVAASSR
jgi:hypothetical protein